MLLTESGQGSGALLYDYLIFEKTVQRATKRDVPFWSLKEQIPRRRERLMELATGRELGAASRTRGQPRTDSHTEGLSHPGLRKYTQHQPKGREGNFNLIKPSNENKGLWTRDRSAGTLGGGVS